MDNIIKYSTSTTTCLCSAFYYNPTIPCKHIKAIRNHFFQIYSEGIDRDIIESVLE